MILDPDGLGLGPADGARMRSGTWHCTSTNRRHGHTSRAVDGHRARFELLCRGCTFAATRPTKKGLIVADTRAPMHTTESAVNVALRATRAAAHGELPGRYEAWWHALYNDHLEPSMRPDITILDVGAGRTPSIPPERRPPRSRYIGLDLSQSELDHAPEGWYDDSVAADVTEHMSILEGSCDLAVSYFVLEHVADLPRAFDNIHSYLVPGGRMVTIFAGTFSPFGLANRLMPHAVSSFILRSLLQRPTESVFPAHYDRCWATAIEKSLKSWSAAEVLPLWYGAPYLAFSRILQALYVGYEEWARVADHPNLAPYYLVSATR